MKKLVNLHHALYRVTDLLPLREPMRKMLRENANTLLTYIIVEADFMRISADADFTQINAGERKENNTGNTEFRIVALAKIEAIQNIFSAVKEIGYCHPVNFDVLQREYEEIGGCFRKMTQEAHEQKSIDIHALSAAQAGPPVQQTGETLDKKEDDFVRVFESNVAIEEKEQKKPLIQEQAEEPIRNSESVFNERQQAIVSFIKERKEVKSTELAVIFSNRFSLKTLQRDLTSLIGQKVIDKQGEKRWAVYRMNPVRNLPLHSEF